MDQALFSSITYSVALRLVGATAESFPVVSQEVLRLLVDHFEVDVSYFRRNDHKLGASLLVAQWPIRTAVGDADPLDTVYFDEADHEFALSRTLAEPRVIRPGSGDQEYQRRITSGTGLQGVSTVAVPLRSGGVTTGILGFVKIGDRLWTTTEISMLKVIASQLAQVGARTLAQKTLEHNARHDFVTGLPNRIALLGHLDENLAAGVSPLWVITVSLLQAKQIAAVLGHVGRDELLTVMARRLVQWAGEGCYVAQAGEAEFVIVVSRTEQTPVDTMAEELGRLARRDFDVGRDSVSIEVSLGISHRMDGDSVDANALVEQSRRAARRTDASRPDRAIWFTPAMQAAEDRRGEIELHMKSAIASGRGLSLDYHPEVDLQTGEIVALEALVRWVHPTLGALEPAEFIAISEEANLAGELDRWVLRTALHQLRQWKDSMPGLRIDMRVNISPAQLVTIDLVEQVRRALGDNGLGGSELCVEITEHAALSDLQRTRATLKGLHELGVQVAIDDFGTGHSSLSNIKDLPVDWVKIDRVFVEDLGIRDDDLAIVRAIMGLATAFDLGVVAEGVRTEAAVQTLLALGCRRGQGFVFARPEDTEATTRRLLAQVARHRR